LLPILSEKVFDMDCLQKHVHGVFEIPLPRNAQKGPKTNVKEKIFGVSWFLGI
jgi:hypothetical protein